MARFAECAAPNNACRPDASQAMPPQGQETRLLCAFTRLCALCTFVLGGPAAASAAPGAVAPQPPSPSALCERATQGAAAASGTPLSTLQALALTETGRRIDGTMRPWPWAINDAGQSRWFASREAALAHARGLLDEGRDNFDVGCFQVNYRWHGAQFATLDEMFDPSRNAAYAAGFLGTLRAELGDWEAAVGAYHSRTPELAQRYLARYQGHLARLAPSPEPAAAEPHPRTGTRIEHALLTASAGSGQLGSIVGLARPDIPRPFVRSQAQALP